MSSEHEQIIDLTEADVCHGAGPRGLLSQATGYCALGRRFGEICEDTSRKGCRFLDDDVHVELLLRLAEQSDQLLTEDRNGKLRAVDSRPQGGSNGRPWQDS